MTSFSTTVQFASLFALGTLLVYTFWLMRSGRLSAHVTVRWLLAEAAAICAVLLWSWLPLFSVTSRLDDRELLVVLAVVLFVFIAFLMLDSLARISTHTHQIKRLTQEIALLRNAAEGRGSETDAPVPLTGSGDSATSRRGSPSTDPQGGKSWYMLLAIVWISGCVTFFVLEMSPHHLVSIKSLLTAKYHQ